ncbi:MAG: hypothetical protein R3F49_12375 [Planctomycetota bacterium]
MPNTDSEDAIRLYLRWIQDPASLVDHEQIAALEARAQGAEDPLERLRALNELQKVAVVDEKSIRAGFIKHARAFANANGISVEAFRQMNVPAADLRAAKLDGGRAPKRSATAASSAHASVPGEVRKRKARVTSDTIITHVPASGHFTVKSVAEASGASEATVRKVIEGLIASGAACENGTMKEPGTRGRAAQVFSRV